MFNHKVYWRNWYIFTHWTHKIYVLSRSQYGHH